MSRLSFRVILGVVVALGACSSSSTPPAGKTCLLNSDCNNPLACSFGRCHVACRETGDCSPGQRCIKSQSGNVCQLDDEKRCPASGACQQPLICAIDLLCHNSCTSAADCPPNQLCASGACSEMSEVGSDGKLKPPSDGGAGGAGGADASVDAPPGGGMGPCGVPESEPNDTRETATAIAPGMFTSCIGTAEDVDFYELTTPSDMTGGYFTISITGYSGWTADVTASTVLDNGELGEVYGTSDGQDLHVYIAAQSGLKYRFAVKGFIGLGSKAPARYDLKVTYTKIDDTFEPNNTRDVAKMISLGTPISAYFFEGAKTLPVKVTDVADWYQVNAAAGNVTVTMEMVPSNVWGDVHIFDPTGKEGGGYGANEGANVTATFMNGPAGMYLIEVIPFGVKAEYSFGKAATPTDVPPNYLHPYKLTVSQ